VKNVIGKRCDDGGMRWIKERVEALLQLRWLEVNGHWDAFVASVNDRLKANGIATGVRLRLQSDSPVPLPPVPGPRDPRCRPPPPHRRSLGSRSGSMTSLDLHPIEYRKNMNPARGKQAIVQLIVAFRP
jgi:hypothetical protein